MKRPHQHVMEKQAELLITSILPEEWIVRAIEHDYGVDLEIEIVDRGHVTGHRIWIQSKAVNRINKRTTWYAPDIPDLDLPTCDDMGRVPLKVMSFSLETKFLKYAMQCTIPVLLFVCDLDEQQVYWLPVRDEVLVNLNLDKPSWSQQLTTTVTIPLDNNLDDEVANSFYGLRWYALEPSRLHAFGILHFLIYQFQNHGRLSGYSIGDGWLDIGEQEELHRTISLASVVLEEALNMSVLFGADGFDYYKESFDIGDINPVPSLLSVIVAAKDAALEAGQMLETGSYSSQELCVRLGRIGHGLGLLSTAISVYQEFRGRFLALEYRALAKAYQGHVNLDPMKWPAFIRNRPTWSR